MHNKKKSAWVHQAALTSSLLLNVLIIISAFYYNQDIFLLLIISIPLAFIAIIRTKLLAGFINGYFSHQEKAPGKLVSTARLHSGHDVNELKKKDLKTVIGNEQCMQPYSRSIFTIELVSENTSSNHSALINENTVGSACKTASALNMYDFMGKEFIWQVGPDYAGCNTKNGHFSAMAFKRIASSPEVKMIEVLLPATSKWVINHDATGIKAEKLSFANNATVFAGNYSTFNDAEGMMHFLESLRKLAGGKPVGVKLCIENKKDFFKLCHAIRKTQFVPDFIVVEECNEMPLYESLEFTSRTLQNYFLKDEIKIIASGKINSAFDILKVIAFGADLIYCKVYADSMKQNFPELSSFGNHQQAGVLEDLLSEGLIKLMQMGGFRNLCDITLPNFFRRMENTGSLHSPLRDTRTLKKIQSVQSGTHPIQTERRKKNIA